MLKVVAIPEGESPLHLRLTRRCLKVLIQNAATSMLHHRYGVCFVQTHLVDLFYKFCHMPPYTLLLVGKVFIFWMCFYPSPSHPVLRDFTASPASWTPQCAFSPEALEPWHIGNGRPEVCEVCFSRYFCSSVVFCWASSSEAEPFFFVFAQFICIQMMLCSLPLSSSL